MCLKICFSLCWLFMFVVCVYDIYVTLEHSDLFISGKGEANPIQGLLMEYTSKVTISIIFRIITFLMGASIIITCYISNIHKNLSIYATILLTLIKIELLIRLLKMMGIFSAT